MKKKHADQECYTMMETQLVPFNNIISDDIA